jgi:NAD-dependent dihydropyrimidine dehydrogenase PreA subunit
MPIDLTDRIIQEPPRKAVKLHPIRRVSQIALGAILALLPLTNGFRIDVTSGRFWLLGQSLTVHSIFLLFYGLAIGAVLLLSVSMVYGRWWCGWVCPQTLASDFGDSLRIRVDKLFRVSKPTSRRLLSTIAWAAAMIIVAVATAAVVLSYFYPPGRVWHAVFNPLSDSRVTSHLSIVAAVIAGDLLWVRRHFCRRGCPYGLMLSLIGDKNTMTVRYLWERDEDCIECGKCVTICPMSIDIRRGANQMECIGCGECIDACNDVLPMIRSRPKPGLIELRYGVDPMRLSSRMTILQKVGLWDARRAFVCFVTLGLMVGFFLELYGPHPTKVSVFPDGMITQEGGYIFERYNLNIANGRMTDIRFRLNATGINNLFLDRRSPLVTVARRDERTLTLTLGAPVTSLIAGQRYPISITVQSIGPSMYRRSVKTIFYVPEPQAQMKAG